MGCRKSNRCEHTNIFSVCVLAVQVVHWDYSGRYHGVDPRSGLHTYVHFLWRLSVGVPAKYQAYTRVLSVGGDHAL